MSIAKWNSEVQNEKEEVLDYSESVHPKPPEEPVNVTFKGKTRPFVNAVVKIKDILKRGTTNDIGDIKARVLDVTEKKSTEILIEVKDVKGRGNALVAIFTFMSEQHFHSIITRVSNEKI